VVYYSFDSSLDAAGRRDVQAAINDYHAKTCIQWVPRTSQAAYVNFRRVIGGGTYAASCYYPGTVRTVTLDNDVVVGSIIHEMGHTVCFGHEQDRNDRDLYLKPGTSCPGTYNHVNGGHLYDYLSVMHYPCEGSCVTPSMPGVTQCTNGSISVLDAEKLNDMYQCTGQS